MIIGPMIPPEKPVGRHRSAGMREVFDGINYLVRTGGGDRQPDGQGRRKRGARGYDAGKKLRGRKRHIVADTPGLLLVVVVHSAAVQDRDGARRVLAGWFPRLLTIFAAGSYAGRLEAFAAGLGGWLLAIVRKQPGKFVVPPRRRVVEWTFAWLNRFRRLSKDYEEHTFNSETMIRLAMISVMLRRLRTTMATS